MVAPAVTFLCAAGNGKVKTQDSLGTWTAIGTLSLTLSTVTFIEGTGSLGEKTSATTKEGYNITAADLIGEPWNFASGQSDDGEHIVVWMYAYEGWDTIGNGAFGIIVADDLATDSYGTWYVGPQAGYIGGWYPYIVSPKKPFNTVTAGTGGWTTNGNPAQLTGVDGFGMRWKITSTISGSADNTYVDAIIVGKGYQITNGDAGATEGKFSDFITWEENTTTGRYGFLRSVSGIPFIRGKLYIGGTGSENTEFIDSGFTVVWEKVTLSDGVSSAVDDGFYELNFQKGSGTTDVTLSQGVLKAVSPHTVVLDFAGATSATLTGVNVDRGSTITLDSAVTWTDSVITNSGQITASGAVFTGNSVSGYTGAADTSAIVWNNAGDPDGNLDNCVITKGTNAHHAIELGTSAPTTINLRGLTFSGFNASDAQNDSVLYLADKGSNTAWTINAIGCTGTVSYKKARSGDTVTVNQGVSLSVHVQDVNTAADIVGARVWVPVTSAVGGWPYNDSVTITSTGTTATVAHTGHGMPTNAWVWIQGANEPEYNGTQQITVTGADSYTYVMEGDPASPATGTITATFIVINDTTDSNGDVISNAYTYSANQPISGRVRLASSSTYYKTSPIAGTIDSGVGLSLTVQLIPDA